MLTTADGARTLDERGIRGPEVVPLGTGRRVDAAAAVAELRRRGLARVVVEGGPTLNAAWLDAGVVDELFVTVAPLLVGDRGRGIAGELRAGPIGLVLHECRVHGSELVLRYRVPRAGYRELPDSTE